MNLAPKVAVTLFHQDLLKLIAITRSQLVLLEVLELMQLILNVIQEQGQDLTIQINNVFLMSDLSQQPHTNWLTAKILCMIHQFKDPVLFTYNLKDRVKCVEEVLSLFMVVLVALQEMTQLLQLRVVLLVAL